MKQDKAQEVEWLRQLNLTYVGLIGTGVLMVQPFLAAPSLDMPAKVSVVAFSVAIPLLAALVMVNWQESFRRRLTSSFMVAGARAIAQGSAFVGVVAAFWHMLWIAGVGDPGERDRRGGGPFRRVRAPGRVWAGRVSGSGGAQRLRVLAFRGPGRCGFCGCARYLVGPSRAASTGGALA